MRNILLIGAGKSASYLIRYLIENAESENLFITIASLEITENIKQIATHSKTKLEILNISDQEKTNFLISQSDIVISMLPAYLHFDIAKSCIKYNKNLVTASYISKEMSALDVEAKAKKLLFMNEIGLDPGIDHMSSMQMIDNITNQGGVITSYKSYCGGLIAPESDSNAWNYKFTWNSRNVILAGQGDPAQFLKKNQIQYTPYVRLFKKTEPIFISKMGGFEGYPNRDSIKYKKLYNLNQSETVIRGTLRKKGFCATWDIFIQLGLTDNSYVIEDSATLTPLQYIQLFLENTDSSLLTNIEKTIQRKLTEDECVKINEIDFSENTTRIGLENATPAQLLEHILVKKWKLQPNDKDMVVMSHAIEYRIGQKKHTKNTQLVVIGENETYTAMAKTVGLPLGICTLLILNQKLNCYGVQIPILKDVYEPILNELKKYNINFE